MATILPRNLTPLEALNLALQPAIAGFQRGQEKVQTSEFLQNLAGALGQQGQPQQPSQPQQPGQVPQQPGQLPPPQQQPGQPIEQQPQQTPPPPPTGAPDAVVQFDQSTSQWVANIPGVGIVVWNTQTQSWISPGAAPQQQVSGQALPTGGQQQQDLLQRGRPDVAQALPPAIPGQVATPLQQPQTPAGGQSQLINLLNVLGGAKGQFGQQLAAQLLSQQVSQAFPDPLRQAQIGDLEAQAFQRRQPIRAGSPQIATANDPSGLAEGTVFQLDPKGNLKVISEAGGVGLSGKDKTNLAVTQAKEFRADPRIENFQIIERSERGMRAALKQATSPNVKSRIASDQALGVLFQKMLDPTSVVRESEFARTPEGAAAINRLLAIAPQLRLGGLKLLDEDRNALVDMAQTLLDGAKISANRAFDEFETRADEIGLNKRIVFGGAKKFEVAPQQNQQQNLNRENLTPADLDNLTLEQLQGL